MMNRGSVNGSVSYDRWGMCTKGYNLPNSKVDECVHLDTLIPRYIRSHTGRYVTDKQEVTASSEALDRFYQTPGVDLSVYLGGGDVLVAHPIRRLQKRIANWYN